MEAFRISALLVLVSFMLHLVWEFFHVKFYTGYEELTMLPIYLWAAIGDVLYTLGAFALVSAFKQSYDWFRDANASDYLGLVAVGFFVALLVEYKAIALHRWAYLPDMPIIPVLGVGFTPLLQMSLLLPLSVFFLALLHRKFAKAL